MAKYRQLHTSVQVCESISFAIEKVYSLEISNLLTHFHREILSEGVFVCSHISHELNAPAHRKCCEYLRLITENTFKATKTKDVQVSSSSFPSFFALSRARWRRKFGESLRVLALPASDSCLSYAYRTALLYSR